MRILGPFVALALVAGAASAQQFPQGAAAREAQLLKRMGPQARAFIQREARREVAAGEANQATATAAAGAYGPTLGASSDADAEALAFLVLMEASRDSESDLKSIMEETKAANAAKAKQRTALQASGSSKAGIQDDSRVSIQNTSRPLTRPVPPRAVDSIQDDSRNRLDSTSELGEMASLRLQMAMDRRSKMMEALSNLMKKQSDTSSSIVSNLK